MTTLIRLFVCDCCGTERRIAGACDYPEGWHESTDFYGQITHADWLRRQCGYVPRKEGR